MKKLFTLCASLFVGFATMNAQTFAFVNEEGNVIENGTKLTMNTVEFAECAGSEEGIEASFAVIEGFVMTAIELMTDPSHLEAIKDEFNKMQKN